MIILGIDPGSVLTGYAILKKDSSKCLEVVDFGCINTSPDDCAGHRLTVLNAELERIIKKHKPEVLAIETLFLNTNSIVNQYRSFEY